MATSTAPLDEALDPSDPYAREAQTFPRLTAEMLARLAPYGTRSGCRRERLLFERGQRSVDFFLVLEGSSRSSTSTQDGARQRLHRPWRAAIHRRARPVQRPRDPGLAGAPARQPRGPGEARRLPPDGDGRAGYRRDHHARLHPAPRRPDPARPGRRGADRPGHGGDTLRLQRFLIRNGYPHRLLDTELDAGRRRLPRRLRRSTPDQLPVVIIAAATASCATRHRARSPTRSA